MSLIQEREIESPKNKEKKKIGLINLIKKDKERFTCLILKILAIQTLLSSIALLLQVLNMQYKISQFLNFRPFIIPILSHTLILPFISSQDTGEFLFRGILIGFFYTIAIQFISFAYLNYISKYKKTQEDSQNKAQLRQLMIFIGSILILTLTDFIRDICSQVERNLECILRMLGSKVFIFILFARFFNGGLKKILNYSDQILKDAIVLGDKNIEKEKEIKDWRYWATRFFNIGYPIFIASLILLLIEYCMIEIKIFKSLEFLKLVVNVASIDFTLINNEKNSFLMIVISKLFFDLIYEFFEIDDSKELNFPCPKVRGNENDTGDKNYVESFKRISFLIIRSICANIALNTMVSINRSFIKNGSVDNLYGILFTFSTTLLLGFFIKLNAQYNTFCKEKAENFEDKFLISSVTDSNLAQAI